MTELDNVTALRKQVTALSILHTRTGEEMERELAARMDCWEEFDETRDYKNAPFFTAVGKNKEFPERTLLYQYGTLYVVFD